MAILVGIDETSGTQDTTQSGVTSNDVGGSLPVLFSTALSFETTAGSQNPVSATALSGATSSSSSGTNVITFSGSVQDVKFTDSTGAALAGLDSGIMTTAGREVFLYTSSHDNNVLLGREGTAGGLADPSGAVAFALYLDTGTGTSSDVGATGAKLWITQFEAIHQDSATNTPNDFVSLAQDLFVSVNTLQNFSLSGAPSGQNLFLMFGDGTPSLTDTTIVVTSEAAATGGTVNTSQGGGSTTIGTDNQMIVPGRGVYFTFVTGANPADTIPNLTHALATDPANIDFQNYFSATGASFQVVQLQPPKAATLMITAINNTGTTEMKTTFIPGEGDANDLQVNINSVVISHSVKVGKTLVTTDYHYSESGVGDNHLAGVTVDFTGNTALVTGVVSGDRIAYSTGDNSGPLQHNRVLVHDMGNADPNLGSAFDIGGFQLTSGNIATTDLGNVAFIDDAPTASAVLGAGSVVNDETPGLQTASGANDTSSATVAALFTGVINTSTQLAAAEYAQGTAAVIDSSASTFGADGQAASNPTVYSLAVSAAGVDSGITTDDGTHILLYVEGSLVVGRIGSSSGAAAFAVSIDAGTGVLSMAQYSAVKHPDTTNPNDSVNVLNTALQAVVVVTDGDGDQSTASVNIGNEVKILDDGPTAAAALGTGSVTNDETPGLQSAGGANDTASATVIAMFSGVTNVSTQLGGAEYAQGTAAVVDASASNFGADGQAASGATSYSLAVSAAGVDSGLQTDNGTHIMLFKEGSLVVGRIGSSAGAAAFAVAIDSSTGVLSMAQYSAVKHPTASNPDTSEAVSVTDSALQAVVTVKDGDGDTNSASVNIGNEVSILDDGPTLAFGNLIGTGTINPQDGAWSMSPGADGLGPNGVDITMDSFQLVKPDNTVVNGTSFTFNETAPSPDASGNYHFTGSVTGDLDNNAATPDVTEHFTMTVFANGTYNLDLVEGFMSTVTESTANGVLKAGSPNAIKTLVIGTDNVEFFSTKPLASSSDLVAAVGLGAPDPDQTTLQNGNFAAIDYTKTVTVSTSGIGDANNVLQGDATAAISSGDESFTANPGTQFTSAKILVDNSVGGYSYTGGERLYYRLIYSDGTDSGQVLVTQDLGLANKGQPTSFTVDGGGKLIDAIQLTMSDGTVKIPAIQFITQTNNLADGLKLGFAANIADGDGDTASSSFVANLSANALGSAFDYVLNGTANALDWFNIDLTASQTKYQVNGFDTGATRDKLVLLGDAAATFAIDNSTADSIVTVHETGGQTDTVTVVGVHLLNTDVALM